MKTYTFEDVKKALENRVKRYVKHYKTDFFDYDLPALEKANTEEKAGFYWMVRECGTWLFNLDGENAAGLIEAVRANYSPETYKEYRIEKSRSGEWIIKKF